MYTSCDNIENSTLTNMEKLLFFCKSFFVFKSI